jgi:hypothetical protein
MIKRVRDPFPLVLLWLMTKVVWFGFIGPQKRGLPLEKAFFILMGFMDLLGFTRDNIKFL